MNVSKLREPMCPPLGNVAYKVLKKSTVVLNLHLLQYVTQVAVTGSKYRTGLKFSYDLSVKLNDIVLHL